MIQGYINMIQLQHLEKRIVLELEFSTLNYLVHFLPTGKLFHTVLKG